MAFETLEDAQEELGRRIRARMTELGIMTDIELARRAKAHLPKGVRFGRDTAGLYRRGKSFPSGSIRQQALVKALETTVDALIPEWAHRSYTVLYGRGKAYVKIPRTVPEDVGREIEKILDKASRRGQL